MRGRSNGLALAALISAALLVIVGVAIISIWVPYPPSIECRRAGGTVTVTGHGEWHCVGATPERGAQ